MGIVQIVIIVAVIAFIVVVGGGFVAVLYLKFKSPKQSWIARCYQIGEGVKELKRDSEGRPISGFTLNDLKPYVKDLLEKIQEDHGITLYKLRALDITTNAVTADHVDVWSKGEKEVHVLIKNDTATLLSKGYDQKVGKVVFTPMERERTELIKSEILIKKDRIKNKDSLLKALFPYVAIVVSTLALIGTTYFLINGVVQVSDSIESAQKDFNNQMVIVSANYLEAAKYMSETTETKNLNNRESKEVLEAQNKEPPPSIE